jgi:iron complex outermembrane receptor protein
MRSDSRATLIAASVAAVLNATAALAAAPAATPAADAGGLEEIIVTAERRGMELQDTPLSIAAISAESMVRKGVEDIADVALFTPNLAINGSRGTGNNQPTFSIRGISGGGGATSERGVALYIDDIYVPRTNGSVFKVFDLERVEVLRGPQGTLFGRNSEGGAIRLITKQPTNEFEAYGKLTVGNLGHRDVVGMVNLPVTDGFALRLQAARLEEDGYVHRGPELLGGTKDWVGRIQAAFQASDDVRITLNALFSDSESNGSPNVFKSWDMSPGINGAGVPANVAIQGNYADWISDWLVRAGQPRLATVDDPRLVRGNYTAPDFCFLDDVDPDWSSACAQKDDNKYRQFDGKFAWNVSDKTTLTLTGGYAKMSHSGITDWVYLGVENRPDIVESEVGNGEILLNTSLFSGAVDLVTGVNLFREQSGTDGRNVVARGTSVFNATTGGAANGDGYAGLYTVADLAVTQTSRSTGLFSSATWHLTQKLNFTGGLRVSFDDKEIQYLRRAGSGPAPTFAGMSPANDFVPSYSGANGATSITVNGSDSWTVLDWRATVDYHFTDDIMAYGTASKAFKDGQFSYTVVANLSGPDQSSIIRPIDPEKVVNLEAGMRTAWFDGRLRVNPTGYWMAWTNRQSAQQQACTPNDPSCPTGFRIITVNSGDVDVYGLELDAQLAIVRGLTLEGSVGTTKYRLKDINANRGPYLFPDQPTPSWNLGLNYITPETGLGMFDFNVNYAYRGPQQTYPGSLTFPIGTADSSYELPSFGIINARLQLTTPGGKNTIALYANNLADKEYPTYATRFGGGFWDSGAGTGRAAPPRSALQWVMGRPREVGVTFQHSF